MYAFFFTFVRFYRYKIGWIRMETRKKIAPLLILCILWTALITVCFLLPPSHFHKLPKWNINHLDKMVHFGFFFIQSILVSLLFRFRTLKSYFPIVIFSTIQALLYGGIIEFLQNEFFNRTGDVNDLIADGLGGFFGALAYPLFFSLFRNDKKTK